MSERILKPKMHMETRGFATVFAVLLILGGTGFLQAQPRLEPVQSGMMDKTQALPEPKASQASFYVKLKSSAKKGMPVRKAGDVVPARELPLQALRQAAEMDQVRKITNVGLSSAPRTQGIFRIDCTHDSIGAVLMQALQADPAVEYVERVPRRRIFVQPPPRMDSRSEKIGTAVSLGAKDPMVTQKTSTWTLPDDPYYQPDCVSPYNIRWHLDLIRAEEAWSVCRGNPEVRVAVVDNAVWGEHEDLQIDASLQYNAVTGEACSAPPAVYGNTRTYSDPDSLHDFYYWSHGTHCAGLVGALTNNGTGIAALAGGVTVMGVFAGDEADPLALVASPEGIAWAVENGADVISMSYGDSDSSQVEHEVIKAAAEQGVVFVSAVGNFGWSIPSYPAAFPEVISVGSCDADKMRSDFSNHGDWVDIWSPGGYDGHNLSLFSTTYSYNILMTGAMPQLSGVYYDMMSGTSMATPLLSSVCALLLSYDSTLNSDEIRSILQVSSQRSPDNIISPATGIVDAAGALERLVRYGKPFRPRQLQSLKVSRKRESPYPDITWTLASSNTDSPDFLRLYRDRTLLRDSIPLDAEPFFVDSTVSAGDTVYYFLCEVKDSRESYPVGDVYFNPELYSLSLAVWPEGAGTVDGAGYYPAMSWTYITARPGLGWKFEAWQKEGGGRFAIDSMRVVMQENRAYTAIFTEDVAVEGLEPVQGLRVVPNPASEFFSLFFPGDAEVEEVRLYDMQSRLVRVYTGKQTGYSLEGISSGLHVVEVRFAGNSSLIGKIVVE